jgi:hypothetical protein
MPQIQNTASTVTSGKQVLIRLSIFIAGLVGFLVAVKYFLG